MRTSSVQGIVNFDGVVDDSNLLHDCLNILREIYGVNGEQRSQKNMLEFPLLSVSIKTFHLRPV